MRRDVADRNLWCRYANGKEYLVVRLNLRLYGERSVGIRYGTLVYDIKQSRDASDFWGRMQSGSRGNYDSLILSGEGLKAFDRMFETGSASSVELTAEQLLELFQDEVIPSSRDQDRNPRSRKGWRISDCLLRG